MPVTSASIRYSRLSVVLHWLMLLLFVAAYASIELRELFARGSPPREAFKSAHFMIGLSIFALVWVRIAARLIWPAPADERAGQGWQRILAGAVYLGLYGLMIGMPIAGWLILSAEGKPIPYFGLALPPLVASNEGLAERVEDLHKLVGTIGYYLIGLHALAALIHHYVLRDGVMARMLPARS